METAKDQGEQAIVAIKSTIPDLAKGLGDDAVRLAQEVSKLGCATVYIAKWLIGTW